MNKFMITKKAKRPASTKDECFYCHNPVSGKHKFDCVLIKKKIKIRAIVEYDIKVPNYWNKEDVEFYLNKSSSCASNIIRDLEKFQSENEICLCGVTEFKYLKDMSGGFLDE